MWDFPNSRPFAPFVCLQHENISGNMTQCEARDQPQLLLSVFRLSCEPRTQSFSHHGPVQLPAKTAIGIGQGPLSPCAGRPISGMPSLTQPHHQDYSYLLLNTSHSPLE